jgi:hypothetical protein
MTTRRASHAAVDFRRADLTSVAKENLMLYILEIGIAAVAIAIMGYFLRLGWRELGEIDRVRRAMRSSKRRG